jgi:hypothetical protein
MLTSNAQYDIQLGKLVDSLESSSALEWLMIDSDVQIKITFNFFDPTLTKDTYSTSWCSSEVIGDIRKTEHKLGGKVRLGLNRLFQILFTFR